MNGVHGLQQTDRYIFRIGLFGGDAESSSLPFVFDDCDGFAIAEAFQFDALIGLDILSQCDLQIDRRGDCVPRFGYS